jgi:WD40 repeat protein
VIHLTYDPRARPTRRSRRRILLLSAVTVIAATVITGIHLKPKLDQLIAERRIQRLVRECEDFTLAADVVVCEQDSTKVRELLKTSDYRQTISNTLEATRVLPPWDALAKKVGLAWEGPALFCHWRQSSGGHRRLVVISGMSNGVPEGFVLNQASYGALPRILRPNGVRSLGISYVIFDNPRGWPITFFAGQPDSRDPSHFTIDYACHGDSGTIDGWLLDDDRVRFRALSGPLKLPLAYFQEAERETDLEHQEPLWLRAQYGPNARCSLSPNGKHVLLVDQTAVQIIDTATGAASAVPIRQPNVYRAIFSPDGSRIVTCGPDSLAHIFDVATGREIMPPLRHEADVETIAFSRAGDRLATGSLDGHARIWNSVTGKLLQSVRYTQGILSAEFTPDGKAVLTVGRSPDDQAHLWNIATGKPLMVFGTGQVNCAALSTDGTKIVTGEHDGFDRMACVWDVETGKLLARSDHLPGEVMSVALSPDGAKFAAATDGYVRAWDSQTGKQLTEPLGDHVSFMHVVRFSPDGKYLLGAGEAGQAVVWDLATGDVVSRAHGCFAYVQAEFTPDGTRMLVGGPAQEFSKWITSMWAVPAGAGK